MMMRMMLSRVILVPLWIACLIACVSTGTALVRNKRQYETEDHNYGICGKPTMSISHGGIKLFPTYRAVTNPKDNSCYSCYPACPPCEPMFYCDDGYNVKGTFHLECVWHKNTHPPIYKWEGTIPTCEKAREEASEEDNNFSSVLVKILPGTLFGVTLIVSAVSWACRLHASENRATNGRAARRTGIRSNITNISIAPSSWRTVGGRTPGLLTTSGAPSYSRFDDSNVEVHQDVSPHSTNNAEATPTTAVSSEDSPSYSMVQLYTQEDTKEDGVEPASALTTSQRTEDE